MICSSDAQPSSPVSQVDELSGRLSDIPSTLFFEAPEFNVLFVPLRLQRLFFACSAHVSV
jgi:hypothetical protein